MFGEIAAYPVTVIYNKQREAHNLISLNIINVIKLWICREYNESFFTLIHWTTPFIFVHAKPVAERSLFGSSSRSSSSVSKNIFCYEFTSSLNLLVNFDTEKFSSSILLILEFSTSSDF